MYLLVLGLDLVFCGECLSGVCIIQTERASAFLYNPSQFSPWIIFILS